MVSAMSFFVSTLLRKGDFTSLQRNLTMSSMI